MTAKLGYLQVSLQRQGNVMEAALSKNPAKRPEARRDAEPVTQWVLQTDIRAMERHSAPTPETPQRSKEPETRALQDSSPEQPGDAGSLSFAEQAERAHRAKVAARLKMMEYARSIQLSLSKSHGGAVEERSEAGKVGQAPTEPGLEVMTVQSRAGGALQVAAWRLRVHQARRRVLIVVLTAVRLRRGLNHPQRMQRVDSFALYIPLALGDEYGRFVEEQRRYMDLATDLRSSKVRASVGVVRAMG